MSEGPLRVLLAHPSAELYGADRVFLETVVAAVERGWTTTVAVPFEGPLTEVLRDTGAEVHVLPMPVLRKAYLRPLGLVRLAGQVARWTPAIVQLVRTSRPDVVYLSTVTSPIWALVGRALRRPVLAHVHEAEEDAPKPVRLGLAAPLLLARRVITNSVVSRDVLVRDIPRLGARTVVVYNGVIGPAHAALPPADLPQTELAGRRLRLVQIGRLSPRKGTDVTVDALAALVADGVDAQLTLVGSVFSGYEWYEQQLRAQVETLGLGDRVAFLGQQEQVWPALADADIALVASRVEPFGNTAVEAMLALRPVVASAAQGLREVIDRPEVGKLVSPGDPAALAAAIIDVRADWPGIRSRLEWVRDDAVRRFAPARYREEVATELVTTSRPR